MLKAGNGYIQGTAARKIDYDVYEENKVLKTKKQIKKNARSKLKTVAICLMLFAVAFLVIYRYALITELNYDIDATTKKYTAIKNDNTRFKVEIDKNKNLNKIKEIAEMRLGMQKPDKSQIIYIKVPKNDFTKVADNGTYLGKGSTLSLLADKVGKVVRFFE